MTDSKPMRAELVDDYRIKCQLLLEEVIDAEEAAKLTAAEIAELRADRDRLQLANARLKAALRLWQDAWATGRNEPMAIAANATKNTLGGAS